MATQTVYEQLDYNAKCSLHNLKCALDAIYADYVTSGQKTNKNAVITALTEISQQAQPFAFTMLTADTHHIGGYVCQYCKNSHAEQYENVIECSSRQVDAFVKWLQEQPFYENTTVIIAGDHPSMDHGYFSRVTTDDYKRHMYNCFLNSAADTQNIKNRQFCAYDMFPTTLAAMGCTIDGDRLGLGTNLLSATPTLLEATNGAIAGEFHKNSAYYTSHFFFK